ncbi:hypothetical protein DFP72DRAFT_914971 [Ephemerocybe angulata]|uniref:Uncharacterized protein n=1 Tax=Ephemerocybe angulata TaxID=980116 RepID=A0A8H6HKX6_9AGAR|nr:hypothetical protein DFP72DRAFT_914971 [Tulosesus angulatus]
MWGAKLSIPKVLFFCLRYYLLVHVGFSLYALRADITPEECKRVMDRVDCELIAKAILYYRVYAFSGQRRRIMVYLVVQCTAILSAAFVLISLAIKTVKYTSYPEHDVGCVPVDGDVSRLGIAFSLLLANIVASMAFMVYIALRKHQQSGFSNGLLTLFYRDSVVYFLFMSLFAILNIVVCFRAPEHYSSIIVQPQAVLHAILSTHMLLHLREWGQRGAENTQDGHSLQLNEVPSRIHFATRDESAESTEAALWAKPAVTPL